MADDSVVEIQRDGEIATVRLNRPGRYNTFNVELVEGLKESMFDVALDDDVRAVILTGNGKAFCAGGDLQSITEASPDHPSHGFHRLAGVFHEAIVEIRTMAKAVVAAVNGLAVGGGFSLAVACDFRVLSTDAYLKVGYTSNGLTMDGGGSFSLPRLVGLGQATELALLDDKVGPQKAVDIGLAHRAVEPDKLMDRSRELAGRLADMPTETLGRTKRLLNRSFDNSLEQQLETERREIAAAADSPDGREGVDAFLNKREPDYRQGDE